MQFLLTEIESFLFDVSGCFVYLFWTLKQCTRGIRLKATEVQLLKCPPSKRSEPHKVQLVS